MVVKKKTKIKRIKKKAIKKKITQKKVTKKILKKPAKPAKKTEGKTIGIVTHYFPKVRAGVVKLKAPLSVGTAIKIKGHTTDFAQTVTSLQINHVPITLAKKGQEIGLLVDSRVRKNDTVYLATQ